MTNKQRQHLLAYLGYYGGDIDGLWGPLSRAALDGFLTDFDGFLPDVQGLSTDFDGFSPDAQGLSTDFDGFLSDAQGLSTDFDGFFSDCPGESGTDRALRQAVAGNWQRPEENEDWWQEITYFKPQETACKCGQHHTPYCSGYPHPMRRQTMLIADRARKHFSQPITIVSGLRCPRHNADVGGVENSQHMYGEALDVYVRGVSQQTVLSWFLSQSDVRYAYAIPGSSNVHFDIHPVGR